MAKTPSGGSNPLSPARQCSLCGDVSGYRCPRRERHPNYPIPNARPLGPPITLYRLLHARSSRSGGLGALHGEPAMARAPGRGGDHRLDRKLPRRRFLNLAAAAAGLPAVSRIARA
jgi:hypothetical protein